MSFKKNVDFCFKSKLQNNLSAKLKVLIIVWKKNLYHTQKLQKQAYNKSIKLRSYAFNNKIWLNNKYIKIKQNWKLEVKFFRLFQVLHPIGK